MRPLSRGTARYWLSSSQHAVNRIAAGLRAPLKNNFLLHVSTSLRLSAALGLVTDPLLAAAIDAAPGEVIEAKGAA